MRTCTVSDTLNGFNAYLARRGRAARTREKYIHFLRQFEQWAGERDLASIASREIELSYLGDWCTSFERAHGRPPSANTVRHHIAALKSFYAFLERFDLIDGRKSDAPDRCAEGRTQGERLAEWVDRHRAQVHALYLPSRKPPRNCRTVATAS